MILRDISTYIEWHLPPFNSRIVEESFFWSERGRERERRRVVSKLWSLPNSTDRFGHNSQVFEKEEAEHTSTWK